MPQTDPSKEKEIVYAFPPPYACDTQDDEIDLLQLWQVIWDARWFIVGVVFVCTLIAAVYSLTLPKEYKSSATLILDQEGNSGGGLSALAASLPISLALPGQGANNSMAFLQSRSLQERLITKYNLLPILYKDSWDADKKTWLVDDPKDAPTLVKALQGDVLSSLYSVSQDKNTELINISWAGEEPEFCHLMLRRVIGELTFFLENEYISDARREREFIEKQLGMATEELEHWERQVPSEKLTLSKISRERLVSQTVYGELRKQLELSKINEAKELETFKVLDAPFIPERHYKPNKMLIVALACVASGFFAIFIVFGRNFIRNARKDAQE